MLQMELAYFLKPETKQYSEALSVQWHSLTFCGTPEDLYGHRVGYNKEQRFADNWGYMSIYKLILKNTPDNYWKGNCMCAI